MLFSLSQSEEIQLSLSRVSISFSTEKSADEIVLLSAKLCSFDSLTQ